MHVIKIVLQIQALLSAMGNELIGHISSEFAKYNQLGRSGLPDLTLWKTSDNACKVFQYPMQTLLDSHRVFAVVC